MDWLKNNVISLVMIAISAVGLYVGITKEIDAINSRLMVLENENKIINNFATERMTALSSRINAIESSVLEELKNIKNEIKLSNDRQTEQNARLREDLNLVKYINGIKKAG